jgi:TonB family protein
MILRCSAIFVLCLALFTLPLKTVAGPEVDCGFSKLRPSRISEFTNRAVIKKATPEYPPAAKAKGMTGTVRIRILINKQGLVERTCPLYGASEPQPDRSLVTAAEAAALQWTFQPNFGFPPGHLLGFDYIQDILEFEFALPPTTNARLTK